MDALSRVERTQKMVNIAREFIPRTYTGRLWQDILFLLIIYALQVTVFPPIVGTWVRIDLITPWLVTGFVHQKVLPSLTLAAIAAITLETHSSIPAGFYFCAYWILSTVITQLRPTLSWRYRVPWFASFLAAETWIIGFESFASYLLSDHFPQNPAFWFSQLARIPLAILFGLLICKRWLTIDAEEPVPP